MNEAERIAALVSEICEVSKIFEFQGSPAFSFSKETNKRLAFYKSVARIVRANIDHGIVKNFEVLSSVTSLIDKDLRAQGIVILTLLRRP